MNRIAIGLLVMLAVGCEQKAAPSAIVEDDVVARPQRPQDVIAHTTARDAVMTGLNAGVATAYRRAELSSRNMSRPAVPTEYAASNPTFTILFGANNQGEREDCGCKANPLGGLTRRATLITASAARNEIAKKWWGSNHDANEHVVVDAGDAFFRNVTMSRKPASHKKQSVYDATSVALALNATPPDAYGVGEVDLVMGIGTLRKLQKAAKFPMISATLLDAKTKKLLFDGHVVVERGTKKLGIIALTKPVSREKNYYLDRGVATKSALQGLVDEIDKMGEVDAFILLSNLGMVPTREMLAAYSGKKPALILVSNSNKLTAEPEWVNGVPMVEPLSRGKYFGRANIYKTGKGDPVYRNVRVDPRRAIQEYRRGWSTYTSARKRINKSQRDEAMLSLELANKALVEGSEEQKRLQARRSYLIRERRRLLSRVDVASQALRTALSALLLLDRDLSKDVKGSDWLELSVVPVKLEIPEGRAERRILDRREANRPELAQTMPHASEE